MYFKCYNLLLLFECVCAIFDVFKSCNIFQIKFTESESEKKMSVV